MKRALTGLAIVCTAFFPAPCVQSQPASPNLLKNPDFEKGTEGWRALVADDPAAKYAITPGAGPDAAACVAYRKTAEGFANSHFDQDFDAEPGKTYAFGAWIRGDGTLKPHLRIADQNWNTIALVPTHTAWVPRRLPRRARVRRRRKQETSTYGRMTLRGLATWATVRGAGKPVRNYFGAWPLAA